MLRWLAIWLTLILLVTACGRGSNTPSGRDTCASGTHANDVGVCVPDTSLTSFKSPF